MKAQRSTLNTQRSTPRRVWLLVLACFCVGVARADVSVVASVDRNHIGFGESVTLTIAVQGTQGAPPPSIPRVDDLGFNGPSTHTSFSFGSGPASQSISFVYRVTPSRTGEFTIPSIEVNTGGKSYRTEPIKLVVEKGAVQNDLSEGLFAKLDCPVRQLYPGQILPLDLYVITRVDVPLRQLSLPQFSAEGLDCRFVQKNWEQQEQQVINGQMFNVFGLHGAITALKLGSQALGPGVVKGGVEIPKQQSNDIFEMMRGPRLREVSVTIDRLPIEVLPLPEDGRPGDFAGAVGEWTLEVMAKPTEVAVGDPITLTIKVGGRGNIDTVPAPTLGSLDGFKTYDPTIKTTKDELNTTGQRIIQQVLIARNTEVKELPEVKFSYFDPVARAYKTAVQPPVKLTVKAGSGGQSTIVGSSGRLRPDEKLGQDIVYLKGDLGPVPPATPFCATPTFWALNIAPLLALVGGIGWKRRADRLRGDVAYARRSRAAKNARKLLASATSYDEVQRALQHYLGDRLNIPAGGITASIVDEQLVPRGVNGELAAKAKACFEACDIARFAGAGAGTGVQATREKVEQLIDELEKKQL